MNIIRENQFIKAAKKLHANQKADLNKALDAIMENPDIGTGKGYDLIGLRVYKFHMVNQQVLLGYTYDELTDTLTLIRFGDHENFYRDLKRN